MIDDALTIRGRASAVLDAGHALRAASTAERVLWLAEAAVALTRDAGERSAELANATGLSVPMVDWASRTTLDTIREDTLLALTSKASRENRHPSEPIAMLAVVLAGNVFTASVRGLVVPLLLGVPVLVKASSRDIMFPAMLRDALRRADATWVLRSMSWLSPEAMWVANWLWSNAPRRYRFTGAMKRLPRWRLAAAAPRSSLTDTA